MKFKTSAYIASRHLLQSNCDALLQLKVTRYLRAVREQKSVRELLALFCFRPVWNFLTRKSAAKRHISSAHRDRSSGVTPKREEVRCWGSFSAGDSLCWCLALTLNLHCKYHPAEGCGMEMRLCCSLVLQKGTPQDRKLRNCSLRNFGYLLGGYPNKSCACSGRNVCLATCAPVTWCERRQSFD